MTKAKLARTGRARSHSGAKKRFKRTGKGYFAAQKAAHNHLLGQKSKRQKRLSGKTIVVSNTFSKPLNRMLPNS